MPPSPRSVFRRPHGEDSFLILNLILLLQFEHMAAFSILGNKGDQLVIIVSIAGRFYLSDDC